MGVPLWSIFRLPFIWVSFCDLPNFKTPQKIGTSQIVIISNSQYILEGPVEIKLNEICFCLSVCLMVFNATFNNISVILWQSVLLVEETTDKLYHIIFYTSPWAGVEPTTSVVIGTDCIGGCKSNYHTITTMMFLEFRNLVLKMFSIGINKYTRPWPRYKHIFFFIKKKYKHGYRFIVNRIFWNSILDVYTTVLWFKTIKHLSSMTTILSSMREEKYVFIPRSGSGILIYTYREHF
jgi:hypothetical protein